VTDDLGPSARLNHLGADGRAAKPFKAIAAMTPDRVIGYQNRIPWHLPEDFQWFKQMTTGHIIVMGRRTFESIGRLLPNRKTIIVSRAGFAPVPPAALVIPGLSDVPEPGPGQEIFICGGASLYAEALPYCSDLYLTLVKRSVAGDTYFPAFEKDFELVTTVRATPEFDILHYRNRQVKRRAQSGHRH
jgi:dihydrofolate reductase